ncbi:MAG: hypothetical protein KDK04_02175 [Candidatus Competibacteraceae bacterium]|nr:hypothetical protein [Candidatus Competibacteraceae bacterium]MCB1810001.1 hypothetical protein [Candidatus Competibacteraceae bacterium]MCB1810519.1 hypothetical protein [Candidatus Competibacteraceae bacterium]
MDALAQGHAGSPVFCDRYNHDKTEAFSGKRCAVQNDGEKSSKRQKRHLNHGLGQTDLRIPARGFVLMDKPLVHPHAQQQAKTRPQRADQQPHRAPALAAELRGLGLGL